MTTILLADNNPYSVTLPSSIKSLSNVAGNFGVNTISKIIEILLTVAILLAFGFIIYGGIKWIISQGDPKNIEAARNTIYYAAIGLGVAMLSLFLVNILGYFFNVPLLGGF